MAIVKGAAIDQLIRHPPSTAVAVLFYGTETGAVRERASSLVKAIAGRLDDPFNVVRLEESELSADPGRLADEFNAISMLGGRRAIWVSDADKSFLKAVEPLLESKPGETFIVAEAGNLSKSSALRLLFEKVQTGIAVPCYEESEQDLHNLVRSGLKEAVVSIEADAEKYLVGLLSSDRLMAKSEIAKLALYCWGQSIVTLADVEAISGDAAEASTDDVIDAVFGGDLAKCDVALSQLLSSGAQVSGVLSMVAAHAARLQQFRLEVERGRSPDEVLRGARPPIFFKRLATMTLQLRTWDTQGLAGAGSSVANAVRMVRETPALDQAIVSRTLLSLARNARMLRMDRH